MADEFIGLGETPVESTLATNSGESDTLSPNETDNVSEVQDRTPTPAHLITVDLIDKKAPIVLLFGAPSSGKTMTLVRLAKYLRPQGYKIIVDGNFCGCAWEYTENMGKFNSMLNTNYALKGTGRNDFLLIKILDKHSKTICQILEGAGEDYFPSNMIAGIPRSRVPFPAYMTTVFASMNKKVWMFLTEPNWRTHADRLEYVDRISFCKDNHFGNNDKCIIVYNKIDSTPYASGDKIMISEAAKACNNEFEGIFNLFPNPSPLPFVSEYACEFVPFSTGTYGLPIPGQQASYVPSKDLHPNRLWKTILKCIKS